MQLNQVWSKNHPFRVPDWRWCRANALYRSTEIPRCEDNDEYVVELINFLRKWRDEKPVPDYQHYAVSIYTTEEYSLMRWELEARLLVNQSDEGIAEMLGLDPRSVHLYEKWCYNVRDKLHNRSYIYQYLIAPKIDDDHEYITKEALWKSYAVFGDLDVLNQVIFDCHTAIDKDRFWLDDLLNTAIRRLATAIRFGKIDTKRAFSELSKIFTLLGKGKVNGDTTSLNGAGEALKSLMSSLQWDWSSKVPDKPMMVNNASLTSKELVQLQGENPGPRFTNFLETATFPE